MRVIHRPVQRINVPDVFVVPVDDAAFLGKDVMIGKIPLHFAEQERLGLVIHFGDQVYHALVIDLMILVVARAQDRPRLAREIFEIR